MSIGPGDIFHQIHTGDYYLVMEKRANNSWAIYDLLYDETTWNWEYNLLDPQYFVRVA